MITFASLFSGQGLGTAKVLAFSALAVLPLATAAKANPTFVSFDVSGAVSTQAFAINDSDVIAGSFKDAGGNIHGFVRDANAMITPFDPPGSLGTTVAAINNDGKITGNFSVSQAEVAYLRKPNGQFVTFGSVPGRTIPLAINSQGVISGVYPGFETGNGFIRAVNGTITVVKVMGSQYTSCDGINQSGAVAGNWFDAGPGNHGYVLPSLGTVTPFDYPGSGYTHVSAINDAGKIAGNYSDASGMHGFIRRVNTTFISFDAPNAAYTLASSINHGGDVAGYSINANNVTKGFVRTASGTITSIHPSGATATYAISINTAGDIAGYCTDSAGTHGFIRTP